MCFKQLSCKLCGKPIAAGDANLDQAIAKCAGCNAVFSLAGDLAAGGGPSHDETMPVPMPVGIKVDVWGSELTIVQRWFSLALLMLVFICVVWNGFLVFWYFLISSTGDSDAFKLVFMLFPMLHVAVGVGLMYFTICGFVNRTVICVSGGELTVRHGPLPWPGNRNVFADDLKQLYCTEHFHRGKNSTSTSYGVNALLAGDRKVKLLSGFTEADQALFIEQRLEEHLRIVDHRVPGEMKR